MFRRKKEKSKNDDNKTSEEKESYVTPSEKLVQEKMSELQIQTDRINKNEKIDVSSIPQDLSDLEVEIQREDEKAQEKTNQSHIHDTRGVVQAKIKPEIKDILPVWVEKPFYYITPPEKYPNRINQWYEAWGPFLLQWGDAKDLYVVAIHDLMQEFPFKNPVIKKALSKEQLTAISDHLVKAKTATWNGKRKTHLRLYWEDKEQTAETIYQWAFNRGQKYISVFDLVDAKQPWSVLPTEELNDFLITLVKKTKAQWADKKREMIYVLFPV